MGSALTVSGPTNCTSDALSHLEASKSNAFGIDKRLESAGAWANIMVLGALRCLSGQSEPDM